MGLSTVSQWLAYISSLPINEISLGLDRVKKVAAELSLLSTQKPIIIVGGTNGKGSTVAGLSSIYRAANYHVGTFTSPLLFKYNEQICVDDKPVTDQELCNAFMQIESARGNTLLTPFEFTTLAALVIFKSYSLDILILEVGLGGRLDAVNILDADLAIVTSIGIDHVDWLGHSREEIGYEKAGIFRPQQFAVCGDFDPPLSLLNHAKKMDTRLYCQEHDFHYQKQEKTWSWFYQNVHYHDLPYNSLAMQNMSTVLMAITLLQNDLPVSKEAIQRGLTSVKLLGRVQVEPGPITHVFDVSHNPDAIAYLAKRLLEMPCQGKTIAVFSMLDDKDIKTSIQMISAEIDAWFSAPLQTKRAASLEKLKMIFAKEKLKNSNFFPTLHDAYQAALQEAKAGDRIVIFGSFHTVSEVMMPT